MSPNEDQCPQMGTNVGAVHLSSWHLSGPNVGSGICLIRNMVQAFVLRGICLLNVNVNVNVNVEETCSHYINIEETSSKCNVNVNEIVNVNVM